MSTPLKTLLVSYLPHGAESATKVLVDTFVEQVNAASGKTELDRLDLLQQVPDHFNLDNTAAYYKRNLGGGTLTPAETQSIAALDRLAQQFVAADIIVLAHPVHNFSVPGLVKLYIDAVAQWGVTNHTGADGQGFPMSTKKMLILSTSLGDYTPGTKGEDIDFTYRYEKHVFDQVMKFQQLEFVTVGQMMGTQAEKLAKLAPAVEQIKALTAEWYK